MNPDVPALATSREKRDDDLLTRAEASTNLLRFSVALQPATLARIWSVAGNGGTLPAHAEASLLPPRGELRAWALRQRSRLRAASGPVTEDRR